MSNEFNREKYLIPITMATGSFDINEAMLLLSYYGYGVIHDKKDKKQYISLKSAIDFNKKEKETCSGNERQFREAVLDMLERIDSYESPSSYSDSIFSLWAKAFPSQAKEVLKSQSKKIDPKLKSIIEGSIK